MMFSWEPLRRHFCLQSANLLSASSERVFLRLAWIYYSALILYSGAEFTHVYTTEFGSFLDEKAGKRECRRSDASTPAVPKMPLIAPSTSNERSAAAEDARGFQPRACPVRVPTYKGGHYCLCRRPFESLVIGLRQKAPQAGPFKTREDFLSTR